MNPPTISGEHRPLIVTMYLGHVYVNNAGTDGVHEVATFQMDWETILEDTELLGRLSAGDMVAQDAKYHRKFLSVLHNRVRKVESEGPTYKANEREVSGIVFAELVIYKEEARLDEETAHARTHKGERRPTGI